MDDSSALARSLSFTVAGYPLYLARTLIQLGYEPVPPTLNGGLPNIFSYLQVIRQDRGYLALYTGMRFVLPAVMIKKCTYDLMSSAIDHKKNVDKADAGEVIAICIKESFLKINSTIITYPITTLTVGYIASTFFGAKEAADYSLAVLYKGIVPKLIFEVVMVWVDIISRRLTVCLVKEETGQAIISRVPPFLAQSLMYPFNVVSTVMVDNGRSRLNPKFDSWSECWTYLSERNELKRGSSLFWRRIRRPVNGIIRPFVAQSNFSSY